MKYYVRTLATAIILASVLNACRQTPTPTKMPSSTIGAPTETTAPTQEVFAMQPDSQFSLASMAIAADESYSMTADDVPGQGACDPGLLRYKVPIFFERVSESFRKKGMSSADVSLQYMGQNSITHISVGIEESLSQRISNPPVLTEKGRFLFNDVFDEFLGYLDGHPNSALIMVTDGDFRVNRPNDDNTEQRRKDTLQKLMDIQTLKKGANVYVVLLCPARLDDASLEFWEQIDYPESESEDGNKKGLARVYVLGKEADGDLPTILRNVLNDILQQAHWAPAPDREFRSGYRMRGWDLVDLPPSQDNHQFDSIPPHSLRVNYGVIPYGEPGPFPETLLDNQPLTSLHALVNPRFDCRNHTLSFMDPGDLFFYWWSVDTPVFWTKWDPDSLYMKNMKGTMAADIRLLVRNSGSIDQTAKGLEDVSEQVDWTFWERCTQFRFFNTAKQKPRQVLTTGRKIEVTDQASGLDFDGNHKKAEEFSVAYTITIEWVSPKISLPVVTKDDVLFDADNHGDEPMYYRFFPLLKEVPTIEENTISWNFDFFSSEYYPSEWERYLWTPTMSFSDKDCVISPVKLDDPRNQTLSYTFNFAVKALPECRNLRLSWDDWKAGDGWEKPPEITCILDWERQPELAIVEPIECKQAGE